MTASSEKKEQVKQVRIQSIYKTALHLFALKGYNGVTTDEITKAAKCSHGLLYHYFGSKEGLFQSLMDNVIIPNYSAAIKDVDINQKPALAIRELVSACLEELKSNNDDFACSIHILLNMYVQKKYIPKSKEVEKRKKVSSKIFEIIDQGKEDGCFHDYDTKEMFVALLAMLRGLSYNRVHLGSKAFTCPNIDIVMKVLEK